MHASRQRLCCSQPYRGHSRTVKFRSGPIFKSSATFPSSAWAHFVSCWNQKQGRCWCSQDSVLQCLGAALFCFKHSCNLLCLCFTLSVVQELTSSNWLGNTGACPRFWVAAVLSEPWEKAFKTLVQRFHLLCCNVAAIVAEYVDLKVSCFFFFKAVLGRYAC